MSRLTIVGLVASGLLLVTLIWLIRTRRLQERFALLWMAAALTVIVFGLWPAALRWLAALLGISYGPSALFLVIGLFVVGLLLYLVIVITRLIAQTQALAQRIALLDERTRETEPPEGDNL